MERKNIENHRKFFAKNATSRKQSSNNIIRETEIYKNIGVKQQRGNKWSSSYVTKNRNGDGDLMLIYTAKKNYRKFLTKRENHTQATRVKHVGRI